jgi:transposase-like protein
MGKPRRTFTREFKVEAVKLVTEQGRSFAEAANPDARLPASSRHHL